MRILLIAYEFPPSPSPQSLRWTYLVRELAARGHEVHVLTADVAGFGDGGLPDVPASVRVHRTYAGHVLGLAANRARRRAAREGSADAAATAPTPAPPPPRHSPEELNWKGRVWHAGLNWKGRIYERVKSLLSSMIFPDVRGEWERWARPRLLELLDELRPDIVVSSHEPATTLRLGLLAKRRGFTWVADLGDPVLAPYTERRWRRKSLALEGEVCRRADLVTVTTTGTRELLRTRHGLPATRCAVITQGFDDRLAGRDAPFPPSDSLDLLYTGSFYRFRRPEALLDAVLATDGVRLSVGTANAPRVLVDAAAAHPDRIRLLGFLPHDASVRLQRCAHVLVNISNESPDQVPGKIYEYMGARRPVLHLHGDVEDAAGQLLLASGRGLPCVNETGAIAAELRRLRAAAAAGTLDDGFRFDDADVAEHGWSRLAARVEIEFARLCARPASHGPAPVAPLPTATPLQNRNPAE